VLLGLVTIFGVIRPALKAIPKPQSPPGKQTSSKLVNETVSDQVNLPSPNHPQMLNMARANPDAVANVVKTWVNKDG
jgi:flagellar biosynthesis/type III secretory pathway M-ring protein FliF/YscJ